MSFLVGDEISAPTGEGSGITGPAIPLLLVVVVAAVVIVTTRRRPGRRYEKKPPSRADVDRDRW